LSSFESECGIERSDRFVLRDFFQNDSTKILLSAMGNKSSSSNRGKDLPAWAAEPQAETKIFQELLAIPISAPVAYPLPKSQTIFDKIAHFMSKNADQQIHSVSQLAHLVVLTTLLDPFDTEDDPSMYYMQLAITLFPVHDSADILVEALELTRKVPQHPIVMKRVATLVQLAFKHLINQQDDVVPRLICLLLQSMQRNKQDCLMIECIAELFGNAGIDVIRLISSSTESYILMETLLYYLNASLPAVMVVPHLCSVMNACITCAHEVNAEETSLGRFLDEEWNESACAQLLHCLQLDPFDPAVKSVLSLLFVICSAPNAVMAKRKLGAASQCFNILIKLYLEIKSKVISAVFPLQQKSEELLTTRIQESREQLLSSMQSQVLQLILVLVEDVPENVDYLAQTAESYETFQTSLMSLSAVDSDMVENICKIIALMCKRNIAYRIKFANAFNFVPQMTEILEKYLLKQPDIVRAICDIFYSMTSSSERSLLQNQEKKMSPDSAHMPRSPALSLSGSVAATVMNNLMPSLATSSANISQQGGGQSFCSNAIACEKIVCLLVSLLDHYCMEESDSPVSLVAITDACKLLSSLYRLDHKVNYIAVKKSKFSIRLVMAVLQHAKDNVHVLSMVIEWLVEAEMMTLIGGKKVKLSSEEVKNYVLLIDQVFGILTQYFPSCYGISQDRVAEQHIIERLCYAVGGLLRDSSLLRNHFIQTMKYWQTVMDMLHYFYRCNIENTNPQIEDDPDDMIEKIAEEQGTAVVEAIFSMIYGFDWKANVNHVKYLVEELNILQHFIDIVRVYHRYAQLMFLLGQTLYDILQTSEEFVQRIPLENFSKGLLEALTFYAGTKDSEWSTIDKSIIRVEAAARTEIIKQDPVDSLFLPMVTCCSSNPAFRNAVKTNPDCEFVFVSMLRKYLKPDNKNMLIISHAMVVMGMLAVEDESMTQRLMAMNNIAESFAAVMQDPECRKHVLVVHGYCSALTSLTTSVETRVRLAAQRGIVDGLMELLKLYSRTTMLLNEVLNVLNNLLVTHTNLVYFRHNDYLTKWTLYIDIIRYNLSNDDIVQKVCQMMIHFGNYLAVKDEHLIEPLPLDYDHLMFVILQRDVKNTIHPKHELHVRIDIRLMALYFVINPSRHNQPTKLNIFAESQDLLLEMLVTFTEETIQHSIWSILATKSVWLGKSMSVLRNSIKSKQVMKLLVEKLKWCQSISAKESDEVFLNPLLRTLHALLEIDGDFDGMMDIFLKTKDSVVVLVGILRDFISLANSLKVPLSSIPHVECIKIILQILVILGKKPTSAQAATGKLPMNSVLLQRQIMSIPDALPVLCNVLKSYKKDPDICMLLVDFFHLLLCALNSEISNNMTLQDQFLDQVPNGFALLLEVMLFHNKTFQNDVLITNVWSFLASIFSDCENDPRIAACSKAFQELRRDILRNYKNKPNLVKTVQTLPYTITNDQIDEIVAKASAQQTPSSKLEPVTASTAKSHGPVASTKTSTTKPASSPATTAPVVNNFTAYLDRLGSNKRDRSATLALCQQVSSLLQRSNQSVTALPWNQMTRCCTLLVEALAHLHKDQEVTRLILTMWNKLLLQELSGDPHVQQPTSNKKPDATGADNISAKREVGSIMSQLIGGSGALFARLLEFDRPPSTVTEPAVPKLTLELVRNLIEFNDKHHPDWALNKRYKSEGTIKGKILAAANQSDGKTSLFYVEGVEKLLIAMIRYVYSMRTTPIGTDITISTCQLIKKFIVAARVGVATVNYDDLGHPMEFSIATQRDITLSLMRLLHYFTTTSTPPTGGSLTVSKRADAVNSVAFVLNQAIIGRWSDVSAEHEEYIPQHKEIFRESLQSFQKEISSSLKGREFEWLLQPVRDNFDAIIDTSEVFLRIIREVLSIPSDEESTSTVTRAAQMGIKFRDCIKLFIDILEHLDSEIVKMNDGCGYRRKDELNFLVCQCLNKMLTISDADDIALVTEWFDVLQGRTGAVLLGHLTTMMQRVKDLSNSSPAPFARKRDLNDVDTQLEAEDNRKLVTELSGVMSQLFSCLNSTTSTTTTNATPKQKKGQEKAISVTIESTLSLLRIMKRTCASLLRIVRMYYKADAVESDKQYETIGQVVIALRELCFHYQAISSRLILLSKEDQTIQVHFNSTTLTLSNSDCELLIDLFIQCCQWTLDEDRTCIAMEFTLALELCEVLRLLCTDTIGVAVNGVVSASFTTKDIAVNAGNHATSLAEFPVGLNVGIHRDRFCTIIVNKGKKASPGKASGKGYEIIDENDLVALLTRYACQGQEEDRLIQRICGILFGLVSDKKSVNSMMIRNLIASFFTAWLGLWVFCLFNHRHNGALLASISQLISFVLETNGYTGLDIEGKDIRAAFNITTMGSMNKSESGGKLSPEALFDHFSFVCIVCHGEVSEAYHSVKALCDRLLAVITGQQLKVIGGAQLALPRQEVVATSCSMVEKSLMSMFLIPNDDLDIQVVLDVNVYQGLWRQCTPVAIKVCKTVVEGSKNASLTANQMENEVEKFVSLRHPRIVSLLGYCLDLIEIRGEQIVSESSSALVLEFMSKGSLRSVIDKEFFAMTMQQKLIMAVDICEGMRFLHSSKISHGDLTSDKGVLIDGDGRAKLTGLWASDVLQSGNKLTYPSSEDIAKDVYDFGVILWQLITGKQRFVNTEHPQSTATTNKKQRKKQVKKSKQLYVSEQERQQSSPALIDWMHKCTNPLAANRPSFAELWQPLQSLLSQQIKHDNDRHKSIPDGFLCPITQDVMRDPVILVDGHSYERAAIVDWLFRSNRSPLTNEVLSSTILTENYALKSAITSYLSVKLEEEKQPVIKREISSSQSCEDCV
jgi:serine/threonine protein kinase